MTTEAGTSGRAASWTRTTRAVVGATPAATESCRRTPPATTSHPPIAHPGTPGDVIDPLGAITTMIVRSTSPATRHGRDGMLEDGATADDGVELVEAAHAAAATGRDDDGVDVGSLHRASVPAARVRRQGAGQGEPMAQRRRRRRSCLAV